jgi:hypothetical protein
VAEGFAKAPFFVESRDDDGDFQVELLRVWRRWSGNANRPIKH